MQHAHTERARCYAGARSPALDMPSSRASRDLLRLLPQLQAGPVVADAALLPPTELRERLAFSCEACLRTIHLGIAALGQLLARCSLELQDGTIGQESVENLGFLMAELGDLASECTRIAAACRADGAATGERACAA